MAQVTRRRVATPGSIHRARRNEPSIPRAVQPRRRQHEARFDPRRRRAPRQNALEVFLRRNLLPLAATVLLVGATAWSLMSYGPMRPFDFFTASPGSVHVKTTAFIDAGKSDSVAVSHHVRIDPATAARQHLAATEQENPASVVAREWGLFAAKPEAAPGKAAQIKPAVRIGALPDAAPEKPATLAPAPVLPAPASDAAAPRPRAIPAVAMMPAAATRLRIDPQPKDFQAQNFQPRDLQPKTTLVDFATAPFPYHGLIPETDKPFLNAGEEGHRGHVNFRGRVYWESETYSDDRVLLHIPANFDARRPAVMIVFFHGHGAELERDVRDRQEVPAQISASGANAVLVAPQFAFDAADSSAGKFWQPDGFKNFLDEAARKLAALYGDPRSAAAFANMPIVIVAYSGGFGPTLSVLDRGGARARVRGLVLLDALYAGIDTFADWIADNRSAFFVSSYTPHTAYHNADLEHQLRERGVAYSSELRPDHLPGMVSFLPAGDISHRDFVNHAWADYPIADILARMENVEPKIAAGAEYTAALPPAAPKH